MMISLQKYINFSLLQWNKTHERYSYVLRNAKLKKQCEITSFAVISCCQTNPQSCNKSNKLIKRCNIQWKIITSCDIITISEAIESEEIKEILYSNLNKTK